MNSLVKTEHGHMGKLLTNEDGMVLVVSLMLVAVLLMLGSTAILTATTDLKIGSNYKNRTETYNIAEAGAEHARAQLLASVAGGTTLSTLLEARAAGAAVLTDSSNMANFYASGAWVTSDVPFINDTTFGSGTYRVYLTNDAVDGLTSKADTNNRVTLTSFGFGPQNSMAVVQLRVGKVIPADAPGAIVMPGPDAEFDAGNSNAQLVDGQGKPAVAVNSADSLTGVVDGIPKPEKFIGGGLTTPSVQNTTLGSPWDSVGGLQSLRDELSAIADFTSTSDSGFTLGTTGSPKIVYINGSVEFGPESGAGILVVTGKLTVHGNFSYDGFILVLGSGEIERKGGGNGQINGSVVMANFTGSPATFGTANYHTSGGGSSNITYSGSALSNSLKNMPFTKQTWREFNL